VIPEREGENTLSKKSDARITQDVMDELAWDPTVTVADLLVSTNQGRVTLTGTVDTYGTTLEAEDAAYRVVGVTFVGKESPLRSSCCPETHQRVHRCSA
jgi:osmotically-inducible protein OsmY